jgi:RNA recognition motif-containing protein
MVCFRNIETRRRNVSDNIDRAFQEKRELMNIYCGNLGYDLSEDELKAAFEAYGEVESARVISDRDTGRSKGFGFVEMPDKSQALAAINGLNGVEMKGRSMTVNEARPKAPPGDRRGGGGGGRNRY